MSIPNAPSSLDNSCAVIHDKTLYAFSPDGFVSLPLKQGGKWKKLPMGEKVTGAKCVGTQPGDPAQAGLFVIGGHSDSEDYGGLQKYTYSTGEWTKINPTDAPTKNRQWHGATYLKAVDRIVVYAGRRDGAQGPGSETFTIQASEPWEVRSFEPGEQGELTAPILLPWSDADAMMIGGDPLSKDVSLFNQDTKWRHWTTLADPIPRDTSTINAVVVNGDDGSKSLLVFDMAASPNEVKRVVLQDASGAPVANSAPVLSTPVDSEEQKRDLTLNDWPEYNSTLASTASRTNYAMAQGEDGMVVFVGGNPDEPIAMFDSKDNAWLNATNVLVEEEQRVLSVSSTTSSASETSSTEISSTETSSTEVSTSESLSTSTSSTFAAETTASATSTGAVSASDSDDSSKGMDSNTILGITLGSIVGFLLLLGLILLCLRRRQMRNNHTETGHARRASGMPTATDEKDSRAYANGAVPPTSPGHFRGHHPQGSQDSFSSMAILMGRMGKEKQHAGKTSHDTGRGSISSLHKQFKSTISKPIPHAEPTVMEERESPASSSNALSSARPRNGPPMPQDGTRRSSGWNRYWSGGSALQLLGFGGAKRNTAVSEQSSRYSESPHTHNPRVTQDSATVPPLNFEGRASMHRVNTGSPVVSQYAPKMPIREGMAGKIERPVSRASSGGYSSGIPESVNEAWDPTAGDRPWGANRAPSSAYAPSFYQANLTPSSSSTNQAQPPSGVSKQPQLAMASTSDMSWLNLGDQRRV